MSHTNWSKIKKGTIIMNGAGKRFMVLDNKGMTIIFKDMETGKEVTASMERYYCGNIRNELIVDKEMGVALFGEWGNKNDN